MVSGQTVDSGLTTEAFIHLPLAFTFHAFFLGRDPPPPTRLFFFFFQPAAPAILRTLVLLIHYMVHALARCSRTTCMACWHHSPTPHGPPSPTPSTALRCNTGTLHTHGWAPHPTPRTTHTAHTLCMAHMKSTFTCGSLYLPPSFLFKRDVVRFYTARRDLFAAGNASGSIHNTLDAALAACGATRGTFLRHLISPVFLSICDV